MKAILVNDETKRLFAGEWDDPRLGADELLVAVKATAVNRADLLQKRGLYPNPPGTSPIIGLEMSGVVDQVGEGATGWKTGDRVFSLLPGGGYAEKATIPADLAIPIPAEMSFEEAAAIPEVFLTAYLNLFMLGDLQPGQTVLIHAGASGVGTAAIQLARAIGANIIITAGSAEKVNACLALGADTGIDYKSEAFEKKVLEATNGYGVDLILDFVGASYFEQNIASLATGGTLIFIGTMGGNKINELNIMQLMRKRLKLIGSTLRSQTVAQKIELTKRFVQFAMPLFENGTLRPIIDSVYDIQQINEAHERMENNLNTGKLVVRMNF